jgi:hypothetical protein
MPSLIRNTVLCMLLLVAASSPAEQITTTVKYVTPTRVYLDAGSLQGIQNGNRGSIVRGETLIAKIEVSFVAERSSSCDILESHETIKVGDRAQITIESTAPPVEPEEEIETSPTYVETEPSRAPLETTTAKPVNRISGRVGVQYVAQRNLSEFNNDYQQPSLLMNLTVDNLFDTHHNLAVRFRSRRNIRDRRTGNLDKTDWDNRIYELSIGYDSPNSPIGYRLGRVYSNRFSAMGYLDGGLISYRANEVLTLGIFGGAQPDQQYSFSSANETKAGIYAAFEKGDYHTNRIDATVALAGQYVSGQISREFLYQQVNLSLRQKLIAFQSAEININRGWRKTAAGSSFQLSNILVNLQYRFTRSLNASVGYDNRQNVYTWDNRSVPDSLFDDHRRQGYRVGASIRLPENLRLSLSGYFRSIGNNENSSEFYSTALNAVNVLKSGVSSGIRIASFNNPYSNGIQASFNASRYFFRRLNLGATLGKSQYTLDAASQDITADWLRINASYFFTRYVYASANAETYRGDDIEYNQVFVDVGVRF